MNEKELRELDLEDIVKEFSSKPAAPEKTGAMDGDTVRLDGLQRAVQEAACSEETAVFHPVSQETAVFQPVTEETARFGPVSQDTAVFAPVEAAAEAEPAAEQAELRPAETAEPYSEGWEPEYDAPIGRYTAPIEFKPKDRQRQLRAQLVAGPEKCYYELSELGLGKLQAGIFLTLLVFVLAAATTLLYELGLVGPERTRLLVFVQLLSLLLAGLLGCYRLMEGLSDITRLRFSLQTLLCISFIICALDGILCLQSERISCCALFCLQMLMAQIGAYEKRRTQLQQMDTLRKATDLEAVVRCEGYMENKAGFLTGPGQLSDFMDSYAAPTEPEKRLQAYGLVSLIVSLGLGVYGCLQGDLASGVQVAAGALLLSMPATAFISQSCPASILQKRLGKLGAVLCGWQGVQAAAGEAVYPLKSGDIFPEGHAKFNGVKFMDRANPDLAVSYAASIVAADGSMLAPLFDKLMRARGARGRQVSDLHDYEGGVSALVDGAPVSLGDGDFMHRMGVEIPKNTRIAHAVYLAVGVELWGVFAISYTRSKSSNSGLRTLCSFKGLQPVLVSNDFCLTPSLLRKKFSADTDKLLRPQRALRQGMAEVAAPEDAPVVALLTRSGLAQRAFPVTGARALRSAALTGAWVHILGGVIGLVAAAVLAWVGGIYLLTPGNLLLYWAIWMVPGWLTAQWTRFV